MEDIWVQERDQKHHSLSGEVTGPGYRGALFTPSSSCHSVLHWEQRVFMTLAASKPESLAQYCLQH